MNVMRKLKIAKVVLNIGVGEAGERLGKAESVLEKISGCKPTRTLSKSTNRDLGIRLGMPIGCKVTFRGKAADKIIKESLWVRENRIPAYCFSKTGGLSFGIPDYTGYKNESYDPDIGIFGLDIAIAFERPGFRVARRKIKSNKVGKNHRISAEECQEFMKKSFGLEVFTV